jgi:hypothetical protein
MCDNQRGLKLQLISVVAFISLLGFQMFFCSKELKVEKYFATAEVLRRAADAQCRQIDGKRNRTRTHYVVSDKRG